MKKLLLALLALGVAHGLTAQTDTFRPMEDVNQVTDLTLDSLEKARTARPAAGSSRIRQNPVLFLVGNSTMRTGTLGNGNNGQWGWGYYADQYFDTEQITVENQALGGTSSRTFYRQLWPEVKKGIRPGDYVIIELGHNDNGPFDSGRARASIRGISPTDSLQVTIKETGRRETVYSYGEYLRRFIRETRALGAHPILMSLTPRNAYEESDGSLPRRVTRVDKTFSLWARQVAEEMNCAFVDLNEISARKYERMSEWKFNYHFYLDHIHTSAFGAQLNARSAADGLLACDHPEVEALKTMMKTDRPTTGVRRKDDQPVVFITGDSTVKNTDRDEDGQWGWGSLAGEIFDTDRVTLMNAAMAGRSCRSYLREGRWDRVIEDVRPGDFVLIQFGHNDAGKELDRGKARNDITGTADSSHVYHVRPDNPSADPAALARYETVYTFGWYLRKMIDDVREKGATPILVSLTPRNEWTSGKIERRNDSFGRWYRDVVEQTGVAFIDLHNITADALDQLGQAETQAYYKGDHTHTSKQGARLNAQSIAKGLHQINSPLAQYLKQ